MNAQAFIERTNDHTSVLSIFKAEETPNYAAVRKLYLALNMRIHPHRGGSFDIARATNCTRIVARAFERIKFSELQAQLLKEGIDDLRDVKEVDGSFVISFDLMYSEEYTDDERYLLRAQAQEEDEDAAAQAAHAAQYGAAESGPSNMHQDDEDDDDDDDEVDEDFQHGDRGNISPFTSMI